MYRAHVSLVLCGLDNTRWSAYSFVDMSCDKVDSEAELVDQGGVKEDPITSSSIYPIDANTAVWDPREYFLTALKVWITRIHQEYEYVVEKVGRGIYRYVGPSSPKF
jgi:hypothetical protein